METTIFYIVSKYFWVAAIAGAVLSALLINRRCRRLVEQTPELAPSCSTLVWGFATWENMPWVVMGIGIMFGRVATAWHYFLQVRENTFVLLWWACVFVTVVVSAYWVFFKGGAELYGKLSELYGARFGSATAVKVFMVGALVATIVLFVFLYAVNPAVPGLIRQLEGSGTP